jgi:hypothetical protein
MAPVLSGREAHTNVFSTECIWASDVPAGSVRKPTRSTPATLPKELSEAVGREKARFGDRGRVVESG